MKRLRSLAEYWPLIGLSVLTALIISWAGLTVQSIFTRQAPPSATLPSPNSPSSVPSWVKTAPPVAPLRLPALSPAPVLPPKPEQPQNMQPATVPSLSPKRNTPSVTSRNVLPQARYGHLPYAEASPDQLAGIGTYGKGAYQREEHLDRSAANAFEQMKAAATAEGISLVPISGFRSIADQEKLFERQIGRQGNPEAAAQLSAPPGYSEHHTGYALDIGDGSRPEADLKFEFENTPAYQWLIVQAKRYGFELSFPPNNKQGVSFEPWHWRYVGSGRAAAIFAVAHTLQGGP